MKQFIEKCLLPTSVRSRAIELLKDPFLSTGTLKEPNYDNSTMLYSMTKLADSEKPDCDPIDIDANCQKLSVCSSMKDVKETSVSNLEVWKHGATIDFSLRGKRADEYTIELVLRIIDTFGE